MSENSNTRRTTVLGDPEEIEILKASGGPGALSRAFRIGCKIALQTSSSDMEQLKQKKEELQQKKILIDGELELIEERILELQNINESKVVEQESEYSKMAYAVDEFMRCSSKIMYHGQNQLCGYLAGICGKSVDDVKKFYNECMIEPSREMIEAFLKE